jgi:hypothetical protein
MAIGTTQYLPLGITVYDCRAPIRRRRVAAICALFVFVAVGFAMAPKTRGFIAMESAESQAARQPGDSVKAAIVQPVAEAFIPAPPIAEPAAPPSSENVSASEAQAELHSVAAPEPVSLPTVIRGAGTKPR